MHATTPSAEPPDHDDPDLMQVLEGLGFGHWHSLLMDLCQRFDGWLVDFLQAPEASPDYRPMIDIVKALRTFPQAQAGQDVALARAIGACDFLSRAARDCWGGRICWDPFTEPYDTFAQRHPERYPYWEAQPARREAELTAWMLGHLPPHPPAATPQQGRQ